LAIVDVVPDSKKLADFKMKVDETYRMPFKKITTSLWLKDLIEYKLHQPVEGVVGIGHNFDTFNLPDFSKKPKKEKPIILMPWRRIKWKGDLDGISALKIVKKNFENIQVIFFDSRRDDIIPEWVDFYANPSQKELKDLYCKADIFLMPSWVEGWSSPPMEAMACGAALVSTKVGGVPEYTINNENALVVPAKDPEALAEAMMKLLRDNSARERIALSGYKHIQQFTWDSVVEKFEVILKNILNGK